MSKNWAVLGAGVSGLTAARLLHDRGDTAVVYEKEPTCGGLARTRITDGFVYDPHGGHIFNSKHPEVVEWVFSVLPNDQWQFNVRNAKIFFDGLYVSYPFELSLCELSEEDALDCAYDYLMAQVGPEPENFRDWLTWNFGAGIADRYMIPYNSKIWAYPLEKMGTSWMRGKMPLPEKKELLRSLVMKDPTERKMPHSTFYYPLHGGIQTMIDAIAEPLDVKLDCAVTRICSSGEGWTVNGEGPYDGIICTIPLKELPDIMDLPSDVSSAIEGLKYNSLNTVLFDCPSTDISWLYIPGNHYRAHRVGYQSALTPYATPNGQGSGALEFIGERAEIDDQMITRGHLIPEELEPNRIIDSQYTEYAYVIHDLNYQNNTLLVRNYFEQLEGFNLTGRWALWNYKNMDLCMKDSMSLVERLIR